MRQALITSVLAIGLFWAMAQPPLDTDQPNNTLDILRDTILPGATETRGPEKKSAADTTPPHKHYQLDDPKQVQQKAFMEEQKKRNR